MKLYYFSLYIYFYKFSIIQINNKKHFEVFIQIKERNVKVQANFIHYIDKLNLIVHANDIHNIKIFKIYCLGLPWQ